MPLLNMMDQDIESAINRALFHLPALAHIWMMNTTRNAKCTITAITHRNITAEMALHNCGIITHPARTVDTGVVDVKENEYWERRNIHAVPLIQHMGNVTQDLLIMREDLQVEYNIISITTQVQWLANHRGIRHGRNNPEITASSVIFVAMRSTVAKGLVTKGIKAAELWYQLDSYTTVQPDSRCMLYC
jgi:hypothetical protein